MKQIISGIVFTLFSTVSYAGLCDQYWFHLGGVSKHVKVYEPNEYTRYKRQTHPGLGFECQNSYVTLASGEFVNSLDRPFTYYTASHGVYSIGGATLFAGLLVGEYGLTVREPLKVYTPVTYLEYRYQHVGINFFALPPVRGFNDYAIFFTQFKLGF